MDLTFLCLLIRKPYVKWFLQADVSLFRQPWQNMLHKENYFVKTAICFFFFILIPKFIKCFNKVQYLFGYFYQTTQTQICQYRDCHAHLVGTEMNIYDNLISPHPSEIICSQSAPLRYSNWFTSRVCSPLKRQNPRWTIFTSSESAMCSVVLWHSSWLSESIGPGRTLSSYWPCWCVISNNLSKCLIGSAPFIEQRHLYSWHPHLPCFRRIASWL